MLDPRHEQRLVARFGDGVRSWITGLDARVEAAAARFGLVPDPVPPLGGSTSVVVPCDHGVLKLTPSARVADDEATALIAWAATPHVVTLLDRDGTTLLLERLRPGQPAHHAALDDVLPVLADLWATRAPALALPTLADRIAFLRELIGQRAAAQDVVPPEIVDPAVARLVSLAEGPGVPGLVHGDLHRGNVLRDADRGPVVVDPRPCLGDRTFDLVDAVVHDAHHRDDLDVRVRILADALPGLDVDRLRAWVDASIPCDAAAAAAADPTSGTTTRLLGLLDR